MFPHASGNNQRLIAVQLRDYSPSTPYTDDELADLRSTDKSRQEIALRANGLEIADFLRKLVVAENIPAVQDNNGKRVGGLVLMSWSMGNLWSLSFFAYLSNVPNDALIVLSRYMRSLVLYGKYPRLRYLLLEVDGCPLSFRSTLLYVGRSCPH